MKDQCYSQQSLRAAEGWTESAEVKMTTLLSKRRRMTRGIMAFFLFPFKAPLIVLFIFCSSGVSESCDSPQESLCGLENGAGASGGGVIVIKIKSNGSKHGWSIKVLRKRALCRIKGQAFTGNSEKASIYSRSSLIRKVHTFIRFYPLIRSYLYIMY